MVKNYRTSADLGGFLLARAREKMRAYSAYTCLHFYNVLKYRYL